MSDTTETISQPNLDQVEQLLEHFEMLEAQFQLVREGLTQSHRLATLGTLASIIAHEYNNILTPIISYAQMALANEEDTELLKKAVVKALQGAERAAKISSSLLGFSSGNDDQPNSKLQHAIGEAINCLARDPSKDGIELTIDVPDLIIMIKPIDLQQVLLNLILNARQAMRPHGGQLHISATHDHNTVFITIADTGPGIPEKICKTLFEPFVTVRSSSQSEPGKAKGTGLGLCICRDLIRNAGGSISVISEPGKGATFHITLPKADDVIETT